MRTRHDHSYRNGKPYKNVRLYGGNVSQRNGRPFPFLILFYCKDNKAEKRKIATALLKFSIFLTTTRTASDNVIGLLSKKTVQSYRYKKMCIGVKIDEANGIEGRNFYSRYVEGKAENYCL